MSYKMGFDRAYNAPQTTIDDAYKARLAVWESKYGEEVVVAYAAIATLRRTNAGDDAVQAAVDYYHSVKFQG